MPDLFSNERHERRKQPKRTFKYIAEKCKSGPRLSCRAGKPRFYDLQIPVAELAPEKLVDRISGLIKSVCRQSIIYLAGNTMQARHDPAVLQSRKLLFRSTISEAGALARAIQIHEHKSGRIPDFIGKSAITFSAAFGEGNVGARRSHGSQSEPYGIR